MRDPPVAKAKTASKKSGNIFIGIGGWTFEPWRGVFYPEELHAGEGAVLCQPSKLTSIEINGTYYGSQKPESFRKWASEMPDGFVFSVKGPRFATNRRVLAEAGDSDRALLRLRRAGAGRPARAGAVAVRADQEIRRGRFRHLPRAAAAKLDGRALRHVVEVRHDSFCTPDFVALLREFDTPVVYAEHDNYPAIADVTGDFVYARLQKGNDEIKTGYPPKALDAWTERLKTWAEGERTGRPAEGRQGQAEEGAARRVRLRHPRGQGARARRRHGADRAGELRWSMAKAKKLFTIGYEQTPPKAVLDELEQAGVKLVVDVRAVTSSRRPGFSKKQLAAGLDERGIAYVHLAALGTPKEGRLAARSGQYDVLEKIYSKHLKTPQAREEMDELVGAGEEGRPGLPALLRARPHPLPSPDDRGDHRGARWRGGEEFGRAAGVAACSSFRGATKSRARKSIRAAELVEKWIPGSALRAAPE